MVETAPPLPLVFFPGAGGRTDNLRPIGPGLGGVPTNPELRSLADLQRHLLASLPSRFDLVTMSMGGVLGLRIALEHPHRIRKLVLLATSGGVDMAALGAVDWRPSPGPSRPDVPSWFVDDRSDLTEQLSEIAHDTLLIYGDDDLIAPPEVGRLLQKHLPRARLEIIPQANHDLELDFPDLIAAFIEAHLRQP